MEKTPKNANNYSCKVCDYNCRKKSEWERHIVTTKHKNRTNRTNLTPKNADGVFLCDCGKTYKARNSYWYHKKKCDTTYVDIMSKNKELEKLLKDNPNVVIELKSHTDFIGNNRSNQRLSQKRADACVDYLVGIGIDPGQLVAVGAGENEPFVIEVKDGRFKEGDVLTESYIRKIKFKKNKNKAHQYNRRTSFKVLREDYIPQSEGK